MPIIYQFDLEGFSVENIHNSLQRQKHFYSSTYKMKKLHTLQSINFPGMEFYLYLY